MPPVVASVAALAGTTSLFGVAAATSVFGLSVGSIGFAALKIGVGLLINAAISGGGSSVSVASQSETKSSLAFPASRMPYRFILGDTTTRCTPLPSPVVGNYFYAVYLAQSRTTSGDVTIIINNQEVTLTGDPYDFSGQGATVTSGVFSGYANVFIGRGDQTSPPDMFLNEAGYDELEDDADLRFKDTDAGTGNTILFIRMDAGPNETRSSRWGGGIPRVSVSGQLTKVFDPRDPTHDIDDQSTWEYSDNQALIALDVLINNPFRPYRSIHLDLESWKYAADVADQLVATKEGGTIKRYRAAGVVVFDGGEIEDTIAPIVMAGASRLSRVGGLLGMVPAIWDEPTHTISESLGALQFSTDDIQGEAPTEVRAEYSPSSRPLESAETPVYVIPNALSDNGGEPSIVSYDLGWVFDHRQAQRVLKILALMARQSKTLSLVGVPYDLNLSAGSNTSVSFPSPFGEYMDGDYIVESTHPGLDPLGSDGVALRPSISLRSTGSYIYEWNASTEEKYVYDPAFNAESDTVSEPGAISITTGNTVNDTTGQVVVPRALFEFTPSPSASVVTYEWQSSKQLDDYSSSEYIDANTRNSSNLVFGYFSGTANELYKIRVRAVSPAGASDWLEVQNITLVVDVILNPPTLNSAIGGDNVINVSFTASSDVDLEYTEIYASDTSLIGDASLIHVSYINQGETSIHIENGLGLDQTRYYFGRTRGSFSSASVFTGPISGTTNS